MQGRQFTSPDEMIEQIVRDYAERTRQQHLPTDQEAAASVHRPIWEEILELTADVPDEEFDRLPVGGADQHDHYIYGTPKRPSAG